jgi:hypothetical protein
LVKGRSTADPDDPVAPPPVPPEEPSGGVVSTSVPLDPPPHAANVMLMTKAAITEESFFGLDPQVCFIFVPNDASVLARAALHTCEAHAPCVWEWIVREGRQTSM